MTDPTINPELTSWVPVPDGSPFPIQNLPYGVFSTPDTPPRVGVAIGEHILDLDAVAAAGLFGGKLPARALFSASTLNLLLARGRAVWTLARQRVSELLATDTGDLRADDALVERALVRQDRATLHLPFAVADYVDFYSSLEHATNIGRMFRPDDKPLRPNWRHLPVGYHGRAATVVVSGTPVVRPAGLAAAHGGGRPVFGPTQALDIELELGFVVGVGNSLGSPITADRAAEHLFGVVLVNDWSARDIQAFEYAPLGPFLGKSFATSISPWVVPLEALAPFRVAAPGQNPEPAEYLRTRGDWALDVAVEAHLQTAAMAKAGMPPQRIIAGNARRLYWTAPQQLAHLTVNGAVVRTGDLFATGTISGPRPGSEGSLIELTWRGERPLELPTGETRVFLEDGDVVTLSAWAGGDERPRIGLGEVSGRIDPHP